jgi:trimeric autotransporter adhesin
VVDGSLTAADLNLSTLPFWRTGGNAGTDPATDFLGTSDDTPLNFRVNDQRALRIEPHASSPSLIGGHSTNDVTAGAPGATISGGGLSGGPNRVTDNYGTVGGGRNNQAGDGAGATSNRASATVAGGQFNTASSQSSAVAGGHNNKAIGQNDSAVGGGFNNTASGQQSTVAGGLDPGADVMSVGCPGELTIVATKFGLTVTQHRSDICPPRPLALG